MLELTDELVTDMAVMDLLRLRSAICSRFDSIIARFDSISEFSSSTFARASLNSWSTSGPMLPLIASSIAS